MAYGIVKWFNNHKGFGFIESHEFDSDIFAHFSEVEMIGFKTLQQGASVVYEPVQGPRGWMAKNIRVIAAPALSPLTTAAATPRRSCSLAKAGALSRLTV